MKKELAVQGYTSSIAHSTLWWCRFIISLQSHVTIRSCTETLERAHRDSNAEGEELNRVNQSRQKKKKKEKSLTLAQGT